MVNFNIITGFLGSGKTTLLKNLLMKNLGKRIAVIQNEFAPSGVDGKELKMILPELKLVEINNGSVFCVCQLSNFIQTVQKLVEEVSPDEIYLETSGLADPISVIELLQDESISKLVKLNKLITLVDAVNFFRGLQLLKRFKHQIMVSDLILINKTDLEKEKLPQIIEEVKKLNPYAETYSTQFAEINDSFFTKVNKNIAELYTNTPSGGKPKEVNVAVLRTHDKILEENLHLFINDLKKHCIRIKGFLKTSEGLVYNIHSAFSETKLEAVENYSAMSELVVFGENITVKELRSKFKFYTKNAN